MSDLEAAISGYETLTAIGEPAALASVRIVGPRALEFANRHLRPSSRRPRDGSAPGEVRRAAFLDVDGAPIDDVLVSSHGPIHGRFRSSNRGGAADATQQLDLRIHFHGGVWPIARCCELLRAAGFVDLATAPRTPRLWSGETVIHQLAWRLLPEFRTLTGARWLARQAMHLPPAVRALSETVPSERRAAGAKAIAARLRFAEWFATPLRIALVGPPNAGKSTLLNALAGETISLVSPRAGTTRDWVDAPGEIAGYPATWIDTAGLRAATDAVESAGIGLTREVLAEVDAVVAVVDGCDAWAGTFLQSLAFAPACIAVNKSDDPAFAIHRVRAVIETSAATKPGAAAPVVAISALTGAGVNDLLEAVLAACGRTVADDAPAAFTPEIADALRRLAAGDDAAALALLAGTA